MIEKLKDLEQKAMDECYDYSHYQEAFLNQHETQCYKAGYIDGLQTAIRIASEDSSTMSYEVDLDQVYDDHDTN